MIQNIVKLANSFHNKGFKNKAGRIDNYIIKCAQENREPSMEDLLEQEEWLSKEDVDPENYMSFEGIEDEVVDPEISMQEEDKGMEAQKTLEELMKTQEAELLRGEEQQSIMEELSQVLMRGEFDSKRDPAAINTPFRPMITPEASDILEDFLKLADMLDAKDKFKEADIITDLMEKLAEPGGFDDMFDNHDEDFESEEPSDEDLMALEDPEDEDNHFFILLGFVERVAKGMYMSQDAAQKAAEDLLNGFDTEHGIQELIEHEAPEALPDNVMEFPGR